MSDGAQDGGFTYYHYHPSMAAAATFITLFLLSTLVHTYQLFRTRTWFLIPLVIGGHAEWVGYLGRALSSMEEPDYTRNPYILQTLLLLLGPAFFAASIYMELGRIIHMTGGDHLALMRRKWLTPIFVTGDVLSILAQGAGGGIMAGGEADQQDLGVNVIIIGLAIQLLFFGLFMVVSFMFERRLRANIDSPALNTATPWRKHLWSLYFISALILIRSIFRLIEFIQGYDGYLMSIEAYLYIFDAVPMFVVVVATNVIHPSEVKAWIKGGKYWKNGYKLTSLRAEHLPVKGESASERSLQQLV